MNNPVAERTESRQTGGDCLIAFGSNEGDSGTTYREVGKRLEGIACGGVLASQLVATAAVGGPKQNDFLNGAFRVATELSPRELHQALISIETEFGRERRQRWGSRRIDLDLLLYGERVYSDSRLQVPHPRMSFRRFVLQPASEIAAEMIHPISGLTIHELLSRINHLPNELWWITAQVAVASTLIGELKEEFPDWHFRLVPRTDPAVHDGAPLPKLIVSDFATRDLHWQAAWLDVAGRGREETKMEVAAALKAMEPASRS
jgi:2-amino-4-hydroxy-6-hydroxymethyldihydropteridine diphosphokinase